MKNGGKTKGELMADLSMEIVKAAMAIGEEKAGINLNTKQGQEDLVQVFGAAFAAVALAADHNPAVVLNEIANRMLEGLLVEMTEAAGNA